MADAEDVSKAFAIAVSSAVLATGILFLFGAEITGSTLVLLTLAVAVLAVITSRETDVSIGYGLITLSLILLIGEYITPDWVDKSFAGLIGIFESALGFEFARIDPLSFFVLSVTTVALLLAARFRLTGERKSARKVADLVANRFASYIRSYLSIGRTIVLLSFAAIVIALQQAAELAGNIGEFMAQAPLVASNIFTALSGFVALGGELPVIGSVPPFNSLSAAGFAVLTVLVIGAAAAVRWRGSGPLAQFLRDL